MAGATPAPTNWWPRVVATATGMVAHLTLGLLIVALVFPPCGDERRRAVIRWWSARLLAIMRVRLVVVPPDRARAARADVVDDTMCREGRGAMLVLNHVSWLDAFIVHALRPAHFIAKAEMARWPLLGFLIDRTGAIFIERGKRHAVREVNHRIVTTLASGELVGVFPEGTVGDGVRLLPFHANLIQPAIDADAPIVVAGLRYRDADGGPTNAMLFVGDVTIVQSALRIARYGPVTAELRLIDAIDATGASRHDVCRAARAMIAAELGFDDEAHEAAEGLSTVIATNEFAISPAPSLAGTAPGTPLDPRDELL